MYYIGLDVHKKTISYCVKDASGQIHREGTIGATRNELDVWIRTLPEPRIMAMEATIFTGWIYDHLRYRRMLAVFEPILYSLGTAPMTVTQLISVLNARRV